MNVAGGNHRGDLVRAQFDKGQSVAHAAAAAANVFCTTLPELAGEIEAFPGELYSFLLKAGGTHPQHLTPPERIAHVCA